jgi:hypothetical protein
VKFHWSRSNEVQNTHIRYSGALARKFHLFLTPGQETTKAMTNLNHHLISKTLVTFLNSFLCSPNHFLYRHLWLWPNHGLSSIGSRTLLASLISSSMTFLTSLEFLQNTQLPCASVIPSTLFSSALQCPLGRFRACGRNQLETSLSNLFLDIGLPGGRLRSNG